MNGLIFSIEELAVHDGEGVRINVFFKGCPLRCKWCHNPEGFEHRQQIAVNPNLCTSCGKCREVCTSPDRCTLCKMCLYECNTDARRIIGTVWEADKLANHLLTYKNMIESCNGGLTFSGGEVLMQSDFLIEILKQTSSMHRIIETSGYGDTLKFINVLAHVDFVYYDLKVIDSEKHKYFTGKDNTLILNNLRLLIESDVPFIIRVPFIKGVNTDSNNTHAMCRLLHNARNLQGIEYLMYNKMAGAKYRLAGMDYAEFTSPDNEDIQNVIDIVHKYNIKLLWRE